MKKHTIVINLFGEPCTGKSTAAAYIFSKLKEYKINVELVTEFVKDLVWEGNKKAITFQPYVLGNQMYRVHKVYGEVDVEIVDSPIPLGLLYNASNYEHFEAFAMEEFSHYNNYNYILTAAETFSEKGRVTSFKQGQEIRKQMLALLDKYKVDYTVISATEADYDKVIDTVIKQLQVSQEE